MSYSESDWLRATKHTHFTFRGVFTYLTVITINMIVFVHGYYSNGFIRPLERKKKNKKNKTLKVISLENAPLSPSVQLLSLTKASKDR